MSIKVKTINNQVVKPIKVNVDNRPIKGKEIYDQSEYFNLYAVAPTASGKTTSLFHILKTIAGKKTTIVAFVSSIYNDENYLEIKKYFKKKGIAFIEHDSIYDDEGNNLLNSYVNDLKEEAKEREEEIKEDENEEKKPEPMTTLDINYLLSKVSGTNNIRHPTEQEQEEINEKKERKQKRRYPEWIFLFDDLADQIRVPAYETLLKKSRHFHITCITASQGLKDITPRSRVQIRVWLLYKGMDEALLKEAYNSMSLRISFDLFEKLYNIATKQNYSFLYVAPRTKDFRINFNKKFILDTD